MNLNLNTMIGELSIGDRLIREKGGILTKHHAVVAEVCQNGVIILAENQIGFGVRTITLSKFLNEGKLIRVENYQFSYEKRSDIKNRIFARLGRSYDLLKYNCEHFVNDVLSGKPISNQVKIGGAIGFGLLMYGAYRLLK